MKKQLIIREEEGENKTYVFKGEAYLEQTNSMDFLHSAEWKLMLQTNSKNPIKEIIKKLRIYAKILEKNENGKRKTKNKSQ